MMRLNKIAGIAMLAAGLALASGAAMAQDTAKKPHVPGQKAIGQAGGKPGSFACSAQLARRDA